MHLPNGICVKTLPVAVDIGERLKVIGERLYVVLWRAEIKDFWLNMLVMICGVCLVLYKSMQRYEKNIYIQIRNEKK